MVESALKAYRTATEGATTPKGKVIFDESGKPVKLSGYEATGQALGFRPQRTAMLSSEKRIFENMTTHYSDKRDRLYDRLRLARTQEGRQSVMKDIQRYNLEVMKYRGEIPAIKRASIKKGDASET